MGYTHYLERKEKLPRSNWKLFIEDAKKILDTADCLLTHMAKKGGEWVNVKGYFADSKVLHFNGAGENSHETMHISRVYERESWETENKPMKFSFCKTAYKPYDKYVTAIALLASLHFGEDIANSSDGERNDWKAGKAILDKSLGIKTKWNGDFSVKLFGESERVETKKTPKYAK
jgi:hypothetical protein